MRFPEHFIRYCIYARLTALVNIVYDGTIYYEGNPNDLSINDIINVYQKQSDEVRPLIIHDLL